MGVLQSIVNVKAKLDDRGMTFMFLGYSQNRMGGTYHMLNLHKNCIILIHDVICKKTYGKYVSRKENTRANIYIL